MTGSAGDSLLDGNHFFFQSVPSYTPLKRTSPLTAPLVPEEDLSLHEMLQIMDVARAVREEQVTVEQQFEIDAVRARIRERLVAAQVETGEHATPAEIDTAIEVYFENLHVYRDPPGSWQTAIARLYVRRRGLLAIGALLGAVGVSGWLMFSSTMPWSNANQAARALATAEDSARTQLGVLTGLAQDEESQQAVTQLATEFHAADAANDRVAIDAVSPQMVRLRTVLEEEYDIVIVSGTGRTSLVDRIWDAPDGQSSTAFYAIVEARDRGGRILSRRIANAEGRETKSVTTWGEQIPKPVFDRLAADKTSDGILNETRFAEKKRGSQQERVTISGPDGKPLERGQRITNWD